MKSIQIKYGCLYFLLLLLLNSSCKESITKPISKGEKPSAVSDYEVESLAGSAKVTFKIPDSKDLLYVKAEYEVSPGNTRETRTSVYKDYLVLDGFPKAGEYKVTLYSVAKGEVQSDPKLITIDVLTPSHINSFNSLAVLSDFGGIRVSYENPSMQEIAINIMSFDELTQEWVREHTQHTKDEEGVFSLRGYEAKERKFSFSISDRWGNNSDTLVGKYTPLYEERINKTKFKALQMGTDTYLPNGGSSAYVITNLWNEVRDNSLNGYYNSGTFFWSASGSPLPQHFSFDMGDKIKLSRFIYYHSTWAFEYNNPKVFELWGSNSPSPDGSDVGWELISTFTSKAPHPSSTAPRSQQPNVIAGQVDGEEFVVPLSAGAYQYYRWRTLQNWGGATSVHIAELTFYGATSASLN